MKFKIGDKVKIVKLIKPNKYCGIGETGEVIAIYNVTDIFPICVALDKANESIDFMEEELELYREKNKMEKTFREVIADIKEGEVWENKNYKIELLSDGGVYISDSKGKEFGNAIALVFDRNPKSKFKLQRKEYTFEEAFKAYEEGKEIQSCFSGEKFKVCSWEDIFNSKEIKEKWYING